MDNSLVSILIPVYNREKYISETVKSALNQTYKNIEIIVVDNKSTDDTWRILFNLSKLDKRIKIFQNDSNIGPVKNWKRCLDEAQGEYGKILWSDDLIAPEFLEKTIPFLENEDVGFVFTGTEIFIDGTEKKSLNYFIGGTATYDSEKYIKGVLFNGNYPVSPGCALFRLKSLKENLLIDIPNKVDSDFSMHAIGNDLLIFLLTANQYKNFAFVNEKLSFFRAHKGSISIQSNDGKLPLYYTLVKAYFLENYRTDFICRLNSQIFFLIRMYRKNFYRLNTLSDFYMINNNFNISYLEIYNKVSNVRAMKKIFNLLKSKLLGTKYGK